MTQIARLKTCVDAWPECATFEYDPRCCRFPKSCSCTVYHEEHLHPGDLEELPDAPELPEVKVGLPEEPGHDKSIEARNQFGEMIVAWRCLDGLNWSPFVGRRNQRPEDWANIVEFALRARLELFICEDVRAP